MERNNDIEMVARGNDDRVLVWMSVFLFRFLEALPDPETTLRRLHALQEALAVDIEPKVYREPR